MAFTLVTWHSRWSHDIHTSHMTFTLVTWHSRWSHGIHTGHMAFTLVTWHSHWSHGIHAGHMTFTLVTWHTCSHQSSDSTMHWSHDMQFKTWHTQLVTWPWITWNSHWSHAVVALPSCYTTHVAAYHGPGFAESAVVKKFCIIFTSCIHVQQG